MLRIAVELPADFASPGEFLADAQAYEAAGAEAVWLGPPGQGPEHLTLLAAVAAMTSRLRLGASLGDTTGCPPALLADTVRTLERLSRNRVVLAVDAGRAPELIAALRPAGAPVRPVLVAGGGEADAERAAHLGDGLLHAHAGADDMDRVAGAFRRARELRPEEAFELWARVPAPGGRAEWRAVLERCGEAGATGIVVAHAANLLDILRNPEEDDRQDLAMAVG
ncbi:MAG TPA: LLM class flavin-dependent oxidoreductase [Candidatus Dormibacteraeota bacterium]|jgi:alkanesulfonate monooxygenase SsuD/methylene tetrahydromethanopterin reductase-like flavin-dependent oxidoreductase (luciferase family)